MQEIPHILWHPTQKNPFTEILDKTSLQNKNKVECHNEITINSLDNTYKSN
jgi:hypothetical protein